MSKFDRIEIFIAVVEENGFAAAARKKGISTAAVSRQITALEKELGVQLLRRTTRQSSLTELGERYYLQCKKTFLDLLDAENSINESKDEATGLLNIMANRYFAMSYILPKLSEFMRKNPKLQIHFQLAERFPHFGEEEIDILFGVSIEGPLELVRRRIATTRYILCASPSYLENYGTPQRPTDLIKHQYITHSIRKPDNMIVFKNKKEIQVNPTLSLNDSYAMRDCAIQGMGIVNLHDYMVLDALNDHQLIEILPEHQEPEQNIYLYYQKNRYLLPKVRKFIDFYVNEK